MTTRELEARIKAQEVAIGKLVELVEYLLEDISTNNNKCKHCYYYPCKVKHCVFQVRESSSPKSILDELKTNGGGTDG
jgi:hypothetical protein